MVKVLVAIRPEDADVVRRFFGEEFDVISCVTLAQAQTALTADLAMVACGVHFDDGRMFDLLQLVKADPQLSAIPFWGILRDEGLLSRAITRGIGTAMQTMGASGLFSLSQLAQGRDEDTVYRELRSVLRQSLS